MPHNTGTALPGLKTITMSIITITSLTLNYIPPGNLAFYVQWRKKSDPDVAASYTNAQALTVDPNGNVIIPAVYKITVPDTPIIVKAINFNNCGPGVEQEFFICEQVTAYGG